MTSLIERLETELHRSKLYSCHDLVLLNFLIELAKKVKRLDNKASNALDNIHSHSYDGR